MKRIFFFGLIVMAIMLGIQNHGTSMVVPVSQADAQDSNCQFRNNDNRTDQRVRHMDGYNICVSADYMERLLQKRPYPQTKIQDSIERRNLTEKLLRFNDPNKISYLTEMTPMGQIVATYTIQGKVSSNQSSLTSTTEGGIASPGDDGSYGENEPGIFFFTTQGVFHQWNGIYSLSDAPEQVTTAPIITYNVNDKPSSSVDIGAK